MRKKSIIAIIILFIASVIGVYVWMNSSKQESKDSAPAQERIANQIKTQQTTETAPAPAGKEESPQTTTQTPTQEAPKPAESTPTQPTEGTDIDMPKTSKAILMQGKVVTVEKDTILEIHDYVEVHAVTAGTRGYFIDFSDLNAVEVISETPRGIPVTVKIKSDVSVIVTAETNTVTFDFKVK